MPTSLSESNLDDEVIKPFQLLDDYSLSALEKKLWEFCRSKILINTTNDSAATAVDLMFYDELLKLVLAFRQKEELELSVMLKPSFSEHTLVSLEGIINVIKHAIPVGVIYNLSRNNDELDLLIVLEKSCTKAYNEFDHVIDLALLGYTSGTCTVHNYGLLNTLINNGHLFYSIACIEPNVVYRKHTDEVFHIDNPQLLVQSKVLAVARFKHGFEKASNFYAGAQYYLASQSFEMAIFMLQQTCELTYRCLLNVLRDKDVKCHSPAVLRKHVKRFAPEVIGVFSEIEIEELTYLQVLEDAYIKSRYNANYSIDYGLISFLNEKVGLLQEKAKEVMIRFTAH